VSWRRTAACIAFTLACLLVFFVAAGLSQFGDCAEDVITGTHQGPCIDQKRIVGWTIIAIGIVTLIVGNWLIIRKRGR